MRHIKYLSVILVIVLICSTVMPCISQIYADMNSSTHVKYDSCDIAEFYFDDVELFSKIQSQLPPGTIPTCNSYPLNYKLWHDKHIVVYGNYKSINSSINTFKTGTQDEQGNKYADGYYKNGTGEYRYHGFDKSGNKYTNVNFINDFKITDPLEENSWLYMPWINKSVTKDKPKISFYNDSAIRGNTKTQEWIGNTAREFEITNGLNISGASASADENNQKYNFINVLSPPSSTHPGEGRMWHKTENGTRYQTFSVRPVTKIPTTVTLNMEILTPISELAVTDTDDMAVQNAIIPVKVRYTATLNDTDFYQNDIERTNRYTRYDIKSWTLKLNRDNNNSDVDEILTGVSFYDNIATVEKTINYTLSEIKSKSFRDTLYGTAYVTYNDKNISNTGNDSIVVNFAGEEEKELPAMVDLLPNIPDKWYDIIEFPASDSTDLTDIVSREVYIDGTQIDAEQFFSGNYIFGESRLWLNQIRMVWNTKDGQALEAIDYTVIYPTKPNAEYRLTGSYIQNRKMNVTDNSLNSNLDFVSSRFPITDYEWSFKELKGESGNLKLKEINTTSKDFLCKKPGTYEIELVVTNSLGRKSEPYVVTFTILEDYTAAVICNLNNSVMARNEEISAYAYEAVSTDGDTIASNIVELWYDSDNNETYDQLIQTWNNVTTFPSYTATKLGKYKFVNIVTEEFGHPTIPEFVTPEDRKTIKVEREFWVDNYIPMTGIYIDIPIVRPEVDVFFMLDQNLKSASTNWIKDNRMNINNTMRLSNIIAKVDNWDLKTYEYSQPASTTRNTGTSYPPTTTTYSSNGYSGTLNFISKSDNGYYEDNGHYATRTLSKTVTMTKDSWEITSSGTTPLANGGYKEWEKYRATYSYDSGGYSGSTSGTGSSSRTYDKDGKLISSTSTDNPTKSGTAYKTETYWVPDMDWVHDYTGYYSGTIYKNEKQPYTAPFVTTHKKYAIYVSDENIANLADLDMVNNNNDIDIILIGNVASQSQIANDYFILNDGSSIESLVNKAIMWIAEQNPIPFEDLLTTQNKPFVLSESDFDEENDLLISKEYQYVHNKDYYDNPTGQEPDTQTTYSDTTGWATAKKDRFANVGLYTIYRRIQDQPTTDPNFEEYNRTSNIPYFTVAVHRIPIAQPTMTWKFDPVASLYELTFEDNSYDLDHQYTRADKGIIDTSIRYRKDAGEWNYKLPTDLTWGNYTIEYLVKDVEQAWSNPYVMNINLSQVPPANITIEGVATPKLLKMRGETTIPAGETLLITSPDKTSGPIIHSNIPITTAQVLVNGVSISSLTLTLMPSETEYLYKTNIAEYNVPANLADGNINLLIRATSNVGYQSKDKDLPVTVYTPIWEDYSGGRLAYISDALAGVPSSMELSPTTAHEKLNDFKVITSKYTNKLEVKIGSITYYIFKNGTVGTNGIGSTSTNMTINNTTQKYNINNISVNTTEDNREWNYKFSVVNNYPLMFNQPVTISITGYDEAGNSITTTNKHSYNPRCKVITPNNYLLYNFRVVKIRELGLESYYRNSVWGAGYQQYIDRPMFVNSMAIDSANFGGITDGLTKGYKFEFEIDSKNFNAIADTIVIEPKFYTTDTFNRNEAELYWEDSNHRVYKVGEGGHAAWKKIILTSADKKIKNAEEATWRGDYMIPGTAWAVQMGTTKSQAKNENLKQDIIVNFAIKGYKNGILQFDYTNDQWKKERTNEKSPYKVGDVIRYSWNKNCLDDIKSKDNR